MTPNEMRERANALRRAGLSGRADIWEVGAVLLERLDELAARDPMDEVRRTVSASIAELLEDDDEPEEPGS